MDLFCIVQKVILNNILSEISYLWSPYNWMGKILSVSSDRKVTISVVSFIWKTYSKFWRKIIHNIIDLFLIILSVSLYAFLFKKIKALIFQGYSGLRFELFKIFL